MLSFNIRLLAGCSSETMYPASDSSDMTANVLRATVLAYFGTVRSCAVNSCAGRPPGWLLDRIFGKRQAVCGAGWRKVDVWLEARLLLQFLSHLHENFAPVRI